MSCHTAEQYKYIQQETLEILVQEREGIESKEFLID